MDVALRESGSKQNVLEGRKEEYAGIDIFCQQSEFPAGRASDHQSNMEASGRDLVFSDAPLCALDLLHWN